jgi:hypothetical protein
LQERDESSGTEDVSVSDQTRDRGERYLAQLVGFLGIGWLPDLLERSPQVDVHWGMMSI